MYFMPFPSKRGVAILAQAAVAVVERATVYQGDTLNGFCRDLAVHQWSLVTEESRNLKGIPRAIKHLVKDAQDRISKDKKIAHSLMSEGPLFQRLAANGAALMAAASSISLLGEEDVFEDIQQFERRCRDLDPWEQPVAEGAEMVSEIWVRDKKVKSEKLPDQGIMKHEKARITTLFAHWDKGQARNVIVQEDLVVDSFLSHLWQNPFQRGKPVDEQKLEKERQRALFSVLMHTPAAFPRISSLLELCSLAWTKGSKEENTFS